MPKVVRKATGEVVETGDEESASANSLLVVKNPVNSTIAQILIN